MRVSKIIEMHRYKPHHTEEMKQWKKVVLKLYVSGKSPRYKRAIEEGHRIIEKLSE